MPSNVTRNKHRNHSVSISKETPRKRDNSAYYLRSNLTCYTPVMPRGGARGGGVGGRVTSGTSFNSGTSAITKENFAAMSDVDRQFLMFQTQMAFQEKIIDSFTTQFKTFFEGLTQTLFQRMDMRFQEIETRLQQEVSKNAKTNSFSVESYLQFEEEKSLRKDKKNNLVLLGLDEVASSGKSDDQVVREIFMECGADPDVITEVKRMGEERESQKFPRLVKIFTNSYEDKIEVLKYHKDVLSKMVEFQGKSFSTYIRHDLTRMQLDDQRKLREERNKKNEDNVDPLRHWIIRRGQLEFVVKRN